MKEHIWFLTADRPNRMQQIRDIEALDDGKRLAILRFKHLVAERHLDVSGITIYNAVLRQGITDEQKFLNEIAHLS